MQKPQDDTEQHNLKNNKNVKIKIIPYKSQPLVIKDTHNRVCILAHGDLWISPFYDFYRRIVNNNLLLFAFNVIDRLTFGIIYDRFSRRISRRRIAEFAFYRSDFDDFMLQRLELYRQNVIKILIDKGFCSENQSFCIIEGHFHLGKSINVANVNYNSLESCFFNKREYLSFSDGLIQLKRVKT